MYIRHQKTCLTRIFQISGTRNSIANEIQTIFLSSDLNLIDWMDHRITFKNGSFFVNQQFFFKFLLQKDGFCHFIQSVLSIVTRQLPRICHGHQKSHLEPNQSNPWPIPDNLNDDPLSSILHFDVTSPWMVGSSGSILWSAKCLYG